MKNILGTGFVGGLRAASLCHVVHISPFFSLFTPIAVIPAPRAYINAVAVKGFVVELWAVERTGQSHPTGLVTPALAAREPFEKLSSRKRFPARFSRVMRVGGRPCLLL